MNRLIWLALLLSYAWGMTFGEYTHNLIHHFIDHHHQHSVPCLSAGFDEIAFDAGPRFSKDSELLSNECGFKLALHAMGQPGVTAQTPAATAFEIHHWVFVPAPKLELWVRAVLLPSAYPQGPPTSNLVDA